MIPPSKEVRRRSIHRWLEDQRAKEFKRLSQSGALDSRIARLDKTMISAFQNREDRLMEQLMREHTWGTQAGMQEFNTRRLMVWGEIREEFLPTTIDLT